MATIPLIAAGQFKGSTIPQVPLELTAEEAQGIVKLIQAFRNKYPHDALPVTLHKLGDLESVYTSCRHFDGKDYNLGEEYE